jgi:nucleoside-diphosphate-sugar epimerase
MRLDVSVNMFVYQALSKGEITVFGGNQIRPNIHIKDLINIYKYFITNPSLPVGFYNAGFENLKIIEIAKKVKKFIPSIIKIKKNNNDPRSYRQSSKKLLSIGFKNNYCVEDAILEIKEKFESKSFKASDKHYTVKWMKKIGL